MEYIQKVEVNNKNKQKQEKKTATEAKLFVCCV